MTIAGGRRGGPYVEQFNAYLGPLPTATHCLRNNRPSATHCSANNSYLLATDCFGNNLQASSTRMELSPNQSLPVCGRLEGQGEMERAPTRSPEVSEWVGARVLAKFPLRPVGEGHGAARARRRPVARRVVDQVEVHVLRRPRRRDPVPYLRRPRVEVLARQPEQPLGVTGLQVP